MWSYWSIAKESISSYLSRSYDTNARIETPKQTHSESIGILVRDDKDSACVTTTRRRHPRARSDDVARLELDKFARRRFNALLAAHFASARQARRAASVRHEQYLDASVSPADSGAPSWAAAGRAGLASWARTVFASRRSLGDARATVATEAEAVLAGASPAFLELVARARLGSYVPAFTRQVAIGSEIRTASSRGAHQTDTSGLRIASSSTRGVRTVKRTAATSVGVLVSEVPSLATRTVVIREMCRCLSSPPGLACSTTTR